jgi:uncharacterized protein YijF (DUF1287 family)
MTIDPARAFERRAVLLALGALAACPALAQSRRSATSVLAAARRQVGVTLQYDPRYERFRFPGGDVSRDRGVCCDVIVRAYRDAFGLDLQALVNADMHAAFRAYPRTWGLARPDSNIDHRRVPNLETFFRRKGAALPLPRDPAGWRPDDIFTSRLGGRLPHIGFVSDRPGARSWLVIHNIGAGACEEDALLDHPLVGRFRWEIG